MLPTNSAMRSDLLRRCSIGLFVAASFTLTLTSNSRGGTSLYPSWGSWWFDNHPSADGAMYGACTQPLFRIVRVAPDGGSHEVVIEADPQTLIPSEPYPDFRSFCRLADGTYGAVFAANSLGSAIVVFQEGKDPIAAFPVDAYSGSIYPTASGDIYFEYYEQVTFDPRFAVISGSNPSVVLESGAYDFGQVLNLDIGPDDTVHMIVSTAGEISYRQMSLDGSVLLETPLPDDRYPFVLKVSDQGDAGVLVAEDVFYSFPNGGTEFLGPVDIAPGVFIGNGDMDFNYTDCGDIFVAWNYAYMSGLATPNCYSGWGVRYAKADGTVGPVIVKSAFEHSPCFNYPEGQFYEATGVNATGDFLFLSSWDGFAYYETLVEDCPFETSDLPADARVYLDTIRSLPNPVSASQTSMLEMRWPSELEGQTPGTVDVSVFDVGGRSVYSTRLERGAGDGVLRTELPNSLAAGIYKVRASAHDVVLTGSITVVR